MNRQNPVSWFFLTLPIRKCYKIRLILLVGLLIALIISVHLLDRDVPYTTLSPQVITPRFEITFPSGSFDPCLSNETSAALNTGNIPIIDPADKRVLPTIERIETLFSKLISYEAKYRSVLDYLGIFLFTNVTGTLHPLANREEKFQEISCLMKHFFTNSNPEKNLISADLLIYLRKVSAYLSSGFHEQHKSWQQTKLSHLDKPVIILASDQGFYETLQASMRTVNEHFPNHTVAIYDLGFTQKQTQLIELNCKRCQLIPFPFSNVEPLAPHIRNLANFAWKPIVVQDAIQRFGTIIYGDTSIRYKTSNFEPLLIDNLIRGFSCRELPGHYLPCFTFQETFHWFNENPNAFEEIYIAEAGFLAVTDNFLSRLIMKSWVTCALDSDCISPYNGHTTCKQIQGIMSTHRFDQSTMVIILSYFFSPSFRQNGKSNPAAYDMFASIQHSLAAVRRFEGDPNYFTPIQTTTQARQ